MKKTRGFTLIEMLIVIAVIGILAVAVLSAINPIEQMRKARDTRRRSNASELLNAIERYYATNEVNPSMSAVGGDDTCDAATVTDAVDSVDLTDLTDSNELKAEFAARVETAGDELYVGFDSTADLAAVCYQIEGQANIEKYTGLGNWCLSGTGTDHYVCLPE